MLKKNNKVFITLLIVAVLFGNLASQILQVHAVLGIGDIVWDPKKWWQDFYHELSENAGKIAMREVGRMIRTLIIHAMDGGPAFVTNWRNYSRKSQDAGGGIARNLIGEAAFGVGGDPSTATLCEHLRDPIGKAFNATPVDQAFADISRAFRLNDSGTYKLLTKCTLPKTIIVNGV